jgi:hypothetical protein
MLPQKCHCDQKDMKAYFLSENSKGFGLSAKNVVEKFSHP